MQQVLREPQVLRADIREHLDKENLYTGNVCVAVCCRMLQYVTTSVSISTNRISTMIILLLCALTLFVRACARVCVCVCVWLDFKTCSLFLPLACVLSLALNRLLSPARMSSLLLALARVRAQPVPRSLPRSLALARALSLSLSPSLPLSPSPSLSHTFVICCVCCHRHGSGANKKAPD